MKRHIVIAMCMLLCASWLGNASITSTSARTTGTTVSSTKEQATVSGQPSVGNDIKHCITGPNRPVQCFKTEAEALDTASHGHIKLPPGQTASSLSDVQLFAASTTVQAILYVDDNYGGSSLTIYNDTCSGWNNLSAVWNDVVSSARTGNCGITLYESTNLLGTPLRINSPGTSNVGAAMNDRASSWSLP